MRVAAIEMGGRIWAKVFLWIFVVNIEEVFVKKKREERIELRKGRKGGGGSTERERERNDQGEQCRVHDDELPYGDPRQPFPRSQVFLRARPHPSIKH